LHILSYKQLLFDSSKIMACSKFFVEEFPPLLAKSGNISAAKAQIKELLEIIGSFNLYDGASIVEHFTQISTLDGVRIRPAQLTLLLDGYQKACTFFNLQSYLDREAKVIKQLCQIILPLLNIMLMEDVPDIFIDGTLREEFRSGTIFETERSGRTDSFKLFAPHSLRILRSGKEFCTIPFQTYYDATIFKKIANGEHPEEGNHDNRPF
jgi:hypothetical protein